MRRKFSTALAVFFAASCLAQSPAQEQKQLLTEYWTAMHHMFVAMQEARSSRSLAVRWNNQGEETRVADEWSCPGGHHMQVFRGRTLVTDFYSLGGKDYRYVNGRWVESAAAKASECRTESEIQRDIANANQSFDRMVRENLDELAAHEAVSKGAIKTVHGIRCQQWTVELLRPPENLPGLRRTATGPESVCISADWHEMERIMPGPDPQHPAVTTHYDWNKPITIRAPR